MAEMGVAASDDLRWVSRLKLASYHARKGQYEVARAEIAAARKRFPAGGSAQITGFINFAEGVCDYFEKGASVALIKLRRAKALALGCSPDDELGFLVSAWLATAYRVLGQWSNMSAELLACFPINGEVSDQVLSRAAIVLADAWQESANYSRAESWYKIAHKHALECGDDLAIGAMLYNRAAIHIFNMRLLDVNGETVDVKACQAALEAASAENYSKYIHDQSMSWVFDLLNGQLMMLKENFVESLSFFRRVTASDLASDWPAVDLVRRADVLRCKSALGEVATKLEIDSFSVLLEDLKDRVGHGDIAVACWSIYLALKEAEPAAARVFMDRSRVAAENHQASQRAEIQALEDFFSNVSNRSSYSSLRV